MNAALLHGVEVYNGNPRQESNNTCALAWAKKRDMIQLSGSDFHEVGDISSGILVEKIPNSEDEFLDILRNGKYQLISTQ